MNLPPPASNPERCPADSGGPAGAVAAASTPAARSSGPGRVGPGQRGEDEADAQGAIGEATRRQVQSIDPAGDRARARQRQGRVRLC